MFSVSFVMHHSLCIIHLVYFKTRHLSIYLTAYIIIIFNLNIDYKFLHFLVFLPMQCYRAYILIVKRFKLYMDFALYKINIPVLLLSFMDSLNTFVTSSPSSHI